MNSDRVHLLQRCLLLEAEIIRLRNEIISIKRLSVRSQRYVTATDVAVMRDMRRRGMKINVIAQKMGWHATTVAKKLQGVRFGQK